MVRFATADDPDVVCLQEVPVWALKRLEEWSGMQAFGATAARPRLGSPTVGMFITRLDPSFFRSAFTGQANAILVARRHQASSPTSHEVSRRGEGEQGRWIRQRRVRARFASRWKSGRAASGGS